MFVQGSPSPPGGCFGGGGHPDITRRSDMARTFKTRSRKFPKLRARTRRTSSYATTSSQSTALRAIKSPYASASKSGVKAGTPCGVVISNICKKTGKPISTIIKSLEKARLCYSQKFNNTYICWPTFPCRKTSKAKVCQSQLWQCFIDWCCISGTCKPVQLEKKTGGQKSFMLGCRSFFSRQVSSPSSKKR